MPTRATIAAIGRPFGLNLVGIASAAAYDALVPTGWRFGAGRSASIIVIGHGGGAFWEAYRRQVDAHPGSAQCADPIDEYTSTVMRASVLPALRAMGLDGRLSLPFGTDEPRLSFVHLAEAAGLGRRSLLGVLLHPEFGPWIAFRGAVVVDQELTAPRPAAGFDPCASCAARPCVAACPAAAVDAAGWSASRCVEHRVRHADVCVSQCDARVACVYGRAHVYPPAALHHHHTRAFALATALPPGVLARAPGR